MFPTILGGAFNIPDRLPDQISIVVWFLGFNGYPPEALGEGNPAVWVRNQAESLTQRTKGRYFVNYF